MTTGSGIVLQKMEYITEYEFKRLSEMGVLKREYIDNKKIFRGAYYRRITKVKIKKEYSLLIIKTERGY